ncbi:MAG TPA: response regulator transcription factor [Solirubrobacteraceae bacterium]|jgi:DNA-binding NarL/FixJ family response regulator|nr:response regulator transcription factor [Solirubrobacteraceae bacterium]
MPTPITVVVIDDHVLFRTGLRELLQQEEIQVVGEASNAESGLEAIKRQAPDVAIMDLSLPRMSGHEAIRQIAQTAPGTQVLVLTISANEADVIEAVLAGACGYLLKDASVGDIVAGVRAAAAGESMVSPRMAKTLLRQLRHHEQNDRRPTTESLSVREKEVLRLVVDGKDNTAIAQELFISPYTVKNHISNILLKLNVENRLQAAVCAVRDSLI